MINKNLAAVIFRQKQDLQILNLEINNIPRGYALVKMKFAGICHTQLNEISGVLGKTNFYLIAWVMKEWEKLYL